MTALSFWLVVIVGWSTGSYGSPQYETNNETLRVSHDLLLSNVFLLMLSDALRLGVQLKPTTTHVG